MHWLTTAIGARLDEQVESLRRQFPTVAITQYGGPVGNLTSFQGHDVGIEVSFASGDSLALSVTVAYLTTTPRVFGDVGWSGSSAAIEAGTVDDWRSSSEWPVATKESLDHVERDLPRLIDEFARAIERGRPPGDP